jgi:hypothetical protein
LLEFKRTFTIDNISQIFQGNKHYQKYFISAQTDWSLCLLDRVG